ncbi:MAG: ATP-binding protein [Candidatus Heimdallarchaeota archaeon]
MKKREPNRTPTHRLAEEFCALSRRILRYANQGYPRIEFLRKVSKMLLDFSGCDVVELRIKEYGKYFCCLATGPPKETIKVEIFPSHTNEDGQNILDFRIDSDLESLCREIILGKFDPSLPFVTKNGSFWIGDMQTPLNFPPEDDGQKRVYRLCNEGEYRSLALIPFVVDDRNKGLLQLISEKRNYFKKYEIEFYEGVAQTLGIAVADRYAQASLRERVKELTCLYGIAKVAEQPGRSLEEILQGTVELLPPSWLYPEIASARIIFDDASYSTPGFQSGRHKQTADIVVSGKKRGAVEVTYREDKLELDEGPFLKEERNLIDEVSRQVALIIERKQSEEEKAKLEVQLRHADRLATIGQLAAGVAHELNEPLSNILGFAQLAKKCAGLPKQTEQDIDKIVSASLYAREVIKKLLIFSRQSPSRKTKVNLNQVVEEGLYFLEARCAKEGIEVVRSLSPNLPEMTADPSQLKQVLVNLVVNSIQAMPEGGKLTIKTFASQDHVSLVLEDNGIGMDEEIKKQIFIPFFTTKDVDQGTGLGLPVVHGIVTSHGGSIEVESKIGHGTRFEIRLPVTGLQEGQ